ncbi:hypothetical protein EJ03DRAFT_7837 [Teratosphaeria nubilosa]|uniref:Uncharacterized protein n=1 Tax=Teratosphaeria nubilosa TaxID=161662 RepID=A0A6G1LPR4_9PEZI|nr:hypothetical protein EJ03DRAFT_7837 [Teratosphaeria nubilosa]
MVKAAASPGTTCTIAGLNSLRSPGSQYGAPNLRRDVSLRTCPYWVYFREAPQDLQDRSISSYCINFVHCLTSLMKGQLATGKQVTGRHRGRSSAYCTVIADQSFHLLGIAIDHAAYTRERVMCPQSTYSGSRLSSAHATGICEPVSRQFSARTAHGMNRVVCIHAASGRYATAAAGDSVGQTCLTRSIIPANNPNLVRGGNGRPGIRHCARSKARSGKLSQLHLLDCCAEAAEMR